MNNCINNLATHGFGIDPDQLNKAYQTIIEQCQPEIDAIKEADKKFEDNPVEIYNDIKALLTFGEDVYEDSID